MKDRRTNENGLGYENYIKSIVNPQNPTPPYMGYRLKNVPPTFDDCEQSTGTMVEIKDGYAEFLQTEWGRDLVARMFVKQATDQINAAGTRSVVWYFSDEQVADYVQKLFTRAGINIKVIWEPRPGEKK